MKRLCIALAIMMTVLSTGSFAAEDTPPDLKGVKVLTATDLEGLIGEPGIRIFDLRKKASFVEGRVPEAISAAPFYDASKDKFDVSLLGPEKTAPIVFYSHGTSGWKSYWASKAAVEAGYSNVMWFRGGYAEWEGGKLPIVR